MVNKKLYAIMIVGLFVFGFAGLVSLRDVPNVYASTSLSAWCSNNGSASSYNDNTCTVVSITTMSSNVTVSGTETLLITYPGAVLINNYNVELTVDYGGNVTISPTGSAYGITNHGEINNSGTISIVGSSGGIGIWQFGGFVTNNAGGNITISGGDFGISLASFFGVVENYGTINVNNSAFGIFENDVYNTGTINISGTGVGVDGSLTNTGIISISNSGAGSVGIGNYNTVLNNTGTINVNNTGGYGISDSTGILSKIINSGWINVENTGSVFNYLGTINNLCGATITVDSSAVFTNEFGTFTNSGTITGTITGTQPVAGSGCGSLVTTQGSSTATIFSGSTSSDQTSSTGISVTISGSLATDGTTVDINTEDLSSQETGVTPSVLVSATYYDVRVFGISDGTAQVCITTSSSSGLTMQYWNGTAWVSATSITYPSSTEVCGYIPVSALTGTNVAIGQLSMVTTPQFPFGTILGVFVPIAALAVFAGERRFRRPLA